MVEIITGVERRRRWRPEDKARIFAEVEEPGASIAIVARRHDVSRGLLWHWRRDAGRPQEGQAPAGQAPFLPVTWVGEPRRSSAETEGAIEIVLPGGVCVRVGRGANLKVLRGVLAALRS